VTTAASLIVMSFNSLAAQTVSSAETDICWGDQVLEGRHARWLTETARLNGKMLG
jgi:hypothetical protein